MGGIGRMTALPRWAVARCTPRGALRAVTTMPYESPGDFVFAEPREPVARVGGGGGAGAGGGGGGGRDGGSARLCDAEVRRRGLRGPERRAAGAGRRGRGRGAAGGADLQLRCERGGEEPGRAHRQRLGGEGRRVP